jgi:hypothetical protein
MQFDRVESKPPNDPAGSNGFASGAGPRLRILVFAPLEALGAVNP